METKSESIYLCRLEQLVGEEADDDRATEQMGLLASILGKLGYRLMSGEAPHFNELWAIRIDENVH